MMTHSVSVSIWSVFRVFLGFVIAPGIGALLWPFVTSPGMIMDEPGMIFWTTLPLGAMFSYPIGVLVGVPTYVVLRLLNRVSAISCVIVGAALASLLFIIFLGPILALLGGGVVGGISGAIFYAVAIAGTPHHVRSGIVLVEACLLVGLLVAGGVITKAAIAKIREIPAHVNRSSLEAKYGGVIDKVEALANIADPIEREDAMQALRTELEHDPAVLRVRIAGPPSSRVFDRIGESVGYGCVGNRIPEQEGVLGCTIHVGLVGRRGILYQRYGVANDPGSTKILFDQGLIDRSLREKSE